MVHTDVGIRCERCAPRKALSALGSSRLRNIIIVVGLVFIVVLLIGNSGLAGGGSSNIPDYSEYVNQFMEELQPEVTATKMIDPWRPDSPAAKPLAGRRLVAIEVTIANTSSSKYPHYVSSSSFKLIDSDGFAFGTAEPMHEPAFREGLILGPGEKTRGWVTFEVDETTTIRSISYGTKRVNLPSS